MTALVVFGAVSSLSTVQAASTDATAVKKSTEQPVYPLWVQQAVVGTPYTPAAFMALPATEQRRVLQTVHPELSPHLITATPSLGAVQMSGVPAAAVTNTPLLNRPALTAVTVPAQSYLDIQPALQTDGTGTAGAVPFATAGSDVTTNATVNIGSFSASDLAQLTFSVSSAEKPLTTDDVHAVLDRTATPYRLSLTISKNGMQALTKDEGSVNGRQVVLQAANSAGKTLRVTFNLWLPLLNRAHATMALGNGIDAQYMYNAFFDMSQAGGSNTTRGTLIDAAKIDMPNINVFDHNTNQRVTGLFADFGMQSKDAGTFLVHSNGYMTPYTSTSLLVGSEQTHFDAFTIPAASGGVTNTYYPNFEFDEIKHVHMYPDDAQDPSLIYLSYDGYFNMPGTLGALGVPSTTEQVVLHVDATIGPSADGSQMGFSEVVTNPQTVNGGERNPVTLNGIYFARTYDTALKTFTPLTDGSAFAKRPPQTDNIPVRFSAQATSGPAEGKTEGVYIRSQTGAPPYIVRYDFNVANGPDGWLGTHWLGYDYYDTAVQKNMMYWRNTTASGEDSDEGGAADKFPVFKTPSGLGQADLANPVNGLAYGAVEGDNDDDYDSGIGMKWSPIDEFKPGDSKKMAFNSLINDSEPPILNVDQSAIRVKKGALSIQIPGTVTDLNSKQANVYVSLTKPDAAKIPPVPTANPSIGSITYTGDPPHPDPVKFTGTLPADMVSQLNDGQEHTIYLYAVDVPQSASETIPQYAQNKAMISNIEPVIINQHASVTLKFQTTAGTELHTPVTKTGIVGDTYNFNTGSGNILTDAADDADGQPPASFQPNADGPAYVLTDPLPANGIGTFSSDPTTITYVYVTQYVEFVPHDLSFGTETIPGRNGATYSVEKKDADDRPLQYQIHDYRPVTNTGITVAARLSAFKDQAATDAGSDLTAASIIFNRAGADHVVTAGSPTAVTLATGLTRSPASSPTIYLDFKSIDLQVAGSAAATLKTHPYQATLTYTVNYGL
ncbi:hypothetical protein L248_0049 [Schleiferilactobacillus shenzhenensis LY-73]|uniref:MucBP domain-containing protein n=1 Tax=Schleiferilactobacillus shenzhenensis LY-73 TaxID=1231336 RepID=U4TSG9_9LACO|nr:hypothetical protein L248_0049 [Schleiferilactobacillus shenzhenensis LY-73]